METEYYWETPKADSGEIAFEVVVDEGALGTVAISYLRSRSYNLGKAICVVEGHEAMLDGYWSRSTSLAQTTVVATGMIPGRYEVSCRTAPGGADPGRRAFRLMGVMSV